MNKEKTGDEKRNEKIKEVDNLLLFSHDELLQAVEDDGSASLWFGMFIGFVLGFISLAILITLFPSLFKN